MVANFDSLFDLMDAFKDEQACIDHLRAIRWRDGEICPHCGGLRVYTFADRKTFKCGDCRKRFSIKVGTIFEDTKLPLRKWFMAIWLITNHPKGVASTTLAKDLKITQKSAWFVLHHLRHAARTNSFNAPLSGTVEADETFVGGKEKNKHADKRTGAGRGYTGKTAVLGLRERDGDLRTMVVPAVSGAVLKPLVVKPVEPGATLMTDEFGAYRGLNAVYDHQTASHSAGEYTRGDTHTNGMKAFGRFSSGRSSAFTTTSRRSTSTATSLR